MKNIIKKSLAILFLATIMLSILPVAKAANENTFKTGDIIEFGVYPQSQVTDSALIKKLNRETLKWVSYGYFSGNNEYGSAKSGDWMKYADIDYNGETYRAVSFSKYRPSFVYFSAETDWGYQKENGYETNKVYWFKYEPVKWRILDPNTGLVMSETIIDSQPYMTTVHTSSSSYETSSIREWLNDDFYNTVFNSSEKSKVKTTSINIDTKSGQKTISDKVFLLSENDIKNKTYGFRNDTNYSTPNDTLVTTGTDYAKCQGLDVSTNWGVSKSPAWLLRTPADWGSGPDTSCVLYVRGDGWSDAPWKDDTGTLTYYGIRPAMCVELTPTVEIQNTATTTINYGDTLVLRANAFMLPSDTEIEWYVDGNGVSINASSDSVECRITAVQSSTITIIAKIVDSNGETVCDDSGNELIDTITVKINAGLWQKIVSFFKNLFGINRVIY